MIAERSLALRSITVRDALAQDRDALLEMVRALQAFEQSLAPGRFGGGSAEKHFSELERWSWRTGGGVLVASEDAPAPVGFAIFGIEKPQGRAGDGERRRYGVVSDLFVASEARGVGIGRALMDEIEARLRSLGVGHLEVTAVWMNGGARRAYEALGFSPTHVTYAKSLGGRRRR